MVRNNCFFVSITSINNQCCGLEKCWYLWLPNETSLNFLCATSRRLNLHRICWIARTTHHVEDQSFEYFIGASCSWLIMLAHSPDDLASSSYLNDDRLDFHPGSSYIQRITHDPTMRSYPYWYPALSHTFHVLSPHSQISVLNRADGVAMTRLRFLLTTWLTDWPTDRLDWLHGCTLRTRYDSGKYSAIFLKPKQLLGLEALTNCERTVQII